jgi:hypothetical protein
MEDEILATEINDMTTIIKARTKNQLLTITERPIIASGDVNTVVVYFEFDPTWAAFNIKFACFHKANQPHVVYKMLISDDGYATVPHEVLDDAGDIFFGVKGYIHDSPEIVKTSVNVKYSIQNGSDYTGGKTPTPDEFAQMMQEVGDIKQTVSEEMAAMNATLQDFAASEEARAANEAARAAAEKIRVEAEASRSVAEDNRDTAESVRQSNEERRASSESLRVSNEIARNSAENGRSIAESGRVSAEEGRQGAEEVRSAAENARAANEAARVAAEASRAAEFEQYAPRITDNATRIAITEKRITNLEKGVAADSFEVDDSVAYVKSVPASSAPYAAISKVGGMTHRVNVGTEDAPVYELRHAAVTGLKTTGKNIFGGEAFADKIMDNVVGATKDTAAGTVTFASTRVSGVGFFDSFKENTQYTIIFYGRNSSDRSRTANIRVSYTDGSTSDNINFDSSGADSFAVVTSKAGKTIQRIYGSNQSSNTILYYDKCGIFEGVLTAEDFEPYVENLAMTIPESVQTLAGYGWGIDGEYNNHVAYEDGRRTWNYRVVKKVFDGTENWTGGSTTGTDSVYYVFKLADYGTIIDTKAVCDKFENVETIGGTHICCCVYNSAGYQKAIVAIRPENAATMTTTKMKELVKSWYDAGAPLVLYYVLATPEVTDISDILSADNLIEVEGGGTITFENEHGYAVPSEVVYQTKGASE